MTGRQFLDERLRQPARRRQCAPYPRKHPAAITDGTIRLLAQPVGHVHAFRKDEVGSKTERD
jgi:hypothetical protein